MRERKDWQNDVSSNGSIFMSRGRNEGPEQERAREEIASTRAAGKKGSGAKNFEKKGFGSEKGMQTNPKSVAAYCMTLVWK
jgi:hypothetical protein